MLCLCLIKLQIDIEVRYPFCVFLSAYALTFDLSVCVYECPSVNLKASYLLGLKVFCAGAGSPSAVCYNIALYLQGRFI